jgi:hypothetical protein
MPESKTYPHLDEPPKPGDLNQIAAFFLAELHLQNELLYSAGNKGAKDAPIPDNETLSMLVNFFRRTLDDPVNRDDPFAFHLRGFVLENGRRCETLLENLRVSLAHQEVT